MCKIYEQIKFKGNRNNYFRINREPIRHRHSEKMSKPSISKLPEDIKESNPKAKLRQPVPFKDQASDSPQHPQFRYPLPPIGCPANPMYPLGLFPHFPFPPPPASLLNHSAALANVQSQVSLNVKLYTNRAL